MKGSCGVCNIHFEPEREINRIAYHHVVAQMRMTLIIRCHRTVLHYHIERSTKQMKLTQTRRRQHNQNLLNHFLHRTLFIQQKRRDHLV